MTREEARLRDARCYDHRVIAVRWIKRHDDDVADDQGSSSLGDADNRLAMPIVFDRWRALDVPGMAAQPANSETLATNRARHRIPGLIVSLGIGVLAISASAAGARLVGQALFPPLGPPTFESVWQNPGTPITPPTGGGTPLSSELVQDHSPPPSELVQAERVPPDPTAAEPVPSNPTLDDDVATSNAEPLAIGEAGPLAAPTTAATGSTPAKKIPVGGGSASISVTDESIPDDALSVQPPSATSTTAPTVDDLGVQPSIATSTTAAADDVAPVSSPAPTTTDPSGKNQDSGRDPDSERDPNSGRDPVSGTDPVSTDPESGTSGGDGSGGGGGG